MYVQIQVAQWIQVVHSKCGKWKDIISNTYYNKTAEPQRF